MELALPETIFRASVKQLKRIILVHLTQQDSTTPSIIWHAALLWVANAILNDCQDHQSRIYFAICVQEYLKLSRSFHIASDIAQGLIVMAQEKQVISPVESAALAKNFEEVEENSRLIRQKVSGFTVDLDLAQTDLKAASVDHLNDRFKQMTTLDRKEG